MFQACLCVGRQVLGVRLCLYLTGDLRVNTRNAPVDVEWHAGYNTDVHPLNPSIGRMKVVMVIALILVHKLT
ncbi:MAG: hypothetical protein MAG451_03235 [Anaerolineales bacterium]|nr:hypothetical protein [Anaerolineales bacterium]